MGCAREPIVDLPVNDAVSLHGRSATVSFRDGTPRPDLLGTAIRPTYQVIPVVPAGWTTAQPVTVWLLCSEGPKVVSCEDQALWLESVSAQPLPLRNAKVIGHGDATKPGTGWFRSVRDAETRHGVRSDPKAIFITVEEPSSWVPSRAPSPAPEAGPVAGFVALSVAVVLAAILGIGANLFGLIRYDADRKKHGAHARSRILVAWAMSFGCMTIWPTMLLAGPATAVMGLLELKAVRANQAPAASRIPAIAAIANGFGWFALLILAGLFAFLWLP